jgi:hypothetical protein
MENVKLRSRTRRFEKRCGAMAGPFRPCLIDCGVGYSCTLPWSEVQKVTMDQLDFQNCCLVARDHDALFPLVG